MIAAGIVGESLTLNVGQDAADRISPSGLMWYPMPRTVLVPVGKSARQSFLCAGEHVDHEVIDGQDRLVHSRLTVDTNRDQRRIQRDRRQAVGGHAQKPSIGCRHCDDADTGSEATQELAELCRVYFWSAQKTIRARKKDQDFTERHKPARHADGGVAIS